MTTLTPAAPAFPLTSTRRALFRATALVALIGALAGGFLAQTVAGPSRARLAADLQAARTQAAAQACSCG